MNGMTLHEALRKYRPHRDLAAAGLIDKLLNAPPGKDPWHLDLTPEEETMLHRILMAESQLPSAAEVEHAVADLVTKKLRAHAKKITEEIAAAEASGDSEAREAVADLLVLRKVVMGALDGLGE